MVILAGLLPLVLLAGLVMLLRRGNPRGLQFWPGKGPVRDTLRTGRAPDAATARQARESAENTVRNVWMVYFYAVLLVIAILLLVFGGRDRAILQGIVAACFAFCFGLTFAHYRRSRRYLTMNE